MRVVAAMLVPLACFVPLCDKERAEGELVKKAPGSYFIRLGTSPGTFTLTSVAQSETNSEGEFEIKLTKTSVTVVAGTRHKFRVTNMPDMSGEVDSLSSLLEELCARKAPEFKVEMPWPTPKLDVVASEYRANPNKRALA